MSGLRRFASPAVARAALHHSGAAVPSRARPPRFPALLLSQGGLLSGPSSGANLALRVQKQSSLGARRWTSTSTAAGSRERTVIIFDWDGTLLCTGLLHANECAPFPTAAQEQLKKSVECAGEILQASVDLGQTFIITNMGAEWVKHSAERWAPALLPTLEHVRVVCTQDPFGPLVFEEPTRWKVEACLDVHRQLDSPAVTNVVAIGDLSDGTDERGEEEFGNLVTKTIHFQRASTPTQHLQQIELVAGQLPQIVGTPERLRMSVE